MQVFTVNENWMNLKNQFMNRWSLLSEEQIEKGQSSFDHLVEEIQGSYGMSPREAEQELTNFLFEDPIKEEMQREIEEAV